jgi:hypothetical protein
MTRDIQKRWGTQNQAFNALLFLYRKVLQIDIDDEIKSLFGLQDSGTIYFFPKNASFYPSLYHDPQTLISWGQFTFDTKCVFLYTPSSINDKRRRCGGIAKREI